MLRQITQTGELIFKATLHGRFIGDDADCSVNFRYALGSRISRRWIAACQRTTGAQFEILHALRRTA
jgi:hypothetical protein